ncbi:MAG: hypothetical protein IKU83_03430 [Lachnospiraceae bacterium]|nr:hypothetical protein [Lachnospiraceae bacterium]
MYCVNCGVKLADTETCCPLCGISVYHPELERSVKEPIYPQGRYPVPPQPSYVFQIVASISFLLPFMITFLVDLQMNGAVTWSGYVMGALIAMYVILILPFWFRTARPVVFVLCDFIAIGMYLLYISVYTKGGWFLTFALPVVSAFGLVITTMVAVIRYLRKGRLLVIGGVLIAFGVFMPLMEFLLMYTFRLPRFAAWSLYPMIVLLLLGTMLIFLGLYRPARETMKRKFFF